MGLQQMTMSVSMMATPNPPTATSIVEANGERGVGLAAAAQVHIVENHEELNHGDAGMPGLDKANNPAVVTVHVAETMDNGAGDVSLEKANDSDISSLPAGGGARRKGSSSSPQSSSLSSAGRSNPNALDDNHQEVELQQIHCESATTARAALAATITANASSSSSSADFDEQESKL